MITRSVQVWLSCNFVLVASNLYILSLFRIPDIGVKSRPTGTHTCTDQRSLAAADQTAEYCSAGGSRSDIDRITVSTIKARLPHANVPHSAISNDALHVVTLGFDGDRRGDEIYAEEKTDKYETE